MTLEFSAERVWFSLLLLFFATRFLGWTRRGARIDTARVAQLVFACGTALLYGLLRVWLGCGLVLPAAFQ